MSDLEAISGNLLYAHQNSVPLSNRQSSEIMNLRRGQSLNGRSYTKYSDDLLSKMFHTSDGVIYFMLNTIPYLALTVEYYNPLFNNLDYAYYPLIKSGNYHPKVEEANASIKHSCTTLIDLSQLRLKSVRQEDSCLEIITDNLDLLNKEEKKLAGAVYGFDLLAANMAMLSRHGIKETAIHIVNPDYVRKEAASIPFVRASFLQDFSNSSVFYANKKNIQEFGYLLGHRKNSALLWKTPWPHYDKKSGEAISDKPLRDETMSDEDIKLTNGDNKDKSNQDKSMTDEPKRNKLLDDKDDENWP